MIDIAICRKAIQIVFKSENMIIKDIDMFLNLTLLGRRVGAKSARTIFICPFLHEKRVLEVPNFVTFPNSLGL